jgi:flagellin
MTVINTNVKSLIAADSMRSSNVALAKAMERLSTGKQINSAKDDAAGLAISTRMTAQVRGLNMAIKNANDGINLAQTAEGAMTEITDMLQRMRELAIQSGNTTNSDLDRSAMNEEIKQLQSEINRVAQTTQFNGINILDGTFNGKLQIGNNSGQTMDLAVSSMSTASMGETVNGVATAATKASLSLGGVANSAAAYSGVAFNATVNGVTKNIVLPTAAPANPVVTKALVGADASVSIKPDQVGLFAERTISMVAAGDIAGKLLISVNDGDVGTQKIDVGTAAANLGYDLTKMTGSMTVKAIQTAIDSSIYFTGDNKVTVGQDANDNITFSVAGGAKKIAVTNDATATTGATLLNLLSGATTTIVATGATASMKAIDGTKPLAGVYAGAPAPSDQVEVFGLQQIAITSAATNRTLGIQVGDGQSVSLNLNTTGADLYLDNMSDVASLIQSKINASGNFTGANAVSVSAVKDANSNWGLSFTNATNQKIVLSDTFMTVASGLANTSNQTTTILPAGTTTKTLSAAPQFGSFAAKTIDLTGVRAADATTAIANSMKAFKLNVNGGGDVSIDMSTALTNMALTETVTTTAISQSQFVRAMQTAIDSTGLFIGNNKVTVGTTDNGQVSLTVAGGAGSIIMKEASDAATTATQYDGLVKALVGTNNGVIGNASESVTSGGKLVLGATYNANIASSATKPAGQMSFTAGGVNTVNELVLNLRDSLGNVTQITTGALTANDNRTLHTLINTALNTPTADTGKVASLYTVSLDTTAAAGAANTFTIKRKDGVDFTLQIDSTTNAAQTLAVTPDSTSSSKLVIGGAAASSSQLVNTFTSGPTRVGAGDGGVYESAKFVISANVTAGNTLTFDNFTYTITPADTAASFNGTADSFVSAYNKETDSKYVASRTLTLGEILFTAKTVGNKTDPALTTGGGGAASTITAGTVVQGVNPTYNVENVLSLKVGNNSYDVTVAATDYEYSTLSQLKDKVQSSIDQTTGLSGANRVVVGITTDSAGKSGLTFTQATGQDLSVSGSFVTNELKVTQTAPSKLVSVLSGGIDLSANNTLAVNLVDANTGASTTKNITLNSTSKNVSLADYAALVQSSINSAFSADGFSVTASSSTGNLSLAMNNQPTKTMTVSGASVSAAFGVGSLQASGVPVNSMASMSDVVREIQADLGDVATVAYDAAKGQMTFAATNGTAGTGNTISLSGAGLAAVQFGGTLAATGAAGNATASKLSDINVLTTAAATSALGSIDNSIEYVSKQRALLGAIENRLAHTVNNLSNIVTNTSASRSAIEDTDYSKETSALAKSQIITQAATAMLAQANQSAQSVLSLLK